MHRPRTGSKELIREMNQALVFAIVRSSGSASRSQIARSSALSPAAVTGIVGTLIEHGLLVETTTGTSLGGRKPILLELVPDAGFVVGIKITDDQIIAVLTDLQATVIERYNHSLTSTSIADVISAMTTAVQMLIPAANGRPVHGVGIGLAGVVDSIEGVVRHATYTSWRDVPLAELLADKIQLPVIVDNDINALVAIERWFGAGRDVANVLLISVGRGVGLGMVLDGQIYRGSRGGAGEFGHVKVSSPGEHCACGATGCLEAEVSDSAIARKLSNKLGRTVSPSEMLERLHRCDPDVVDLYRDAASTLGQAASNLVNVLSPDLVVVTGEGPGAMHSFETLFANALRNDSFAGFADRLQIVVEAWDEESWARGAASLVLSELFSPSDRHNQKRQLSLLR